MTQRLIIYIDENWPDHPSAPWVLLDERDRLVQEGRSEPRHWPNADSCEIVLGATQASWLATQLPRTASRHQDRVLRYALENQLVKDVEDQHLVVTRRRTTEDGIAVNVLVVGRSRLRRLLAQFEALGRRPARMVSELQTAPTPTRPATWTLTPGPTGGLVIRHGEQQGLAADPAFVNDLLMHLQRQPDAAAQTPQTLEIHAAVNGALPKEIDAAALQQATGLNCQIEPRHNWWKNIRAASDLLHGEFASAVSRPHFLKLRAPLWLAAAAAAIWLTASLGAVLWQRGQLHTAETRMLRLFEATLPNVPPVAPARQLVRSLDDVKSRHGLLRRDDFLSLLAVYSETRGAGARHSLRSLEYDNGTLRLTLNNGDAEELSLLQARFAALGYLLAASGDGSNRVALTVREQP